MLTEASISGLVDRLVGLKENVILGHLIPAGTAFKPYLEMHVKQVGEPLPERQLTPEAAHAAMQDAAVAVAGMAATVTPLGPPVQALNISPIEEQRDQQI